MNLAAHARLEAWQEEAVNKWLDAHHPTLGAQHGIADVYTGAGKTFLGFGCMAAASRKVRGLKFAVICPSGALATQWVRELRQHTDIRPDRVGMVGKGEQASFATHDAVVYVLDSARKETQGVPRLVRDVEGHAVMLVVDECHRSGAARSVCIYQAKTVARLGLSATPQRTGSDGVDDDGLPLPVERQGHGRALGGVFYTLSLRDGLRLRMLPRFLVNHHGVALTPAEADMYARHEETIRDRRKKLQAEGGDPDRYQRYVSRRGPVTDAQHRAAKALEEAYFARKMFLYRASERLRVARCILKEAWASSSPPAGAMLFNERIGDDDSEEEDDTRNTDETGETDADAGHGEGAVRTSGARTLWEQIRADASQGLLPFSAARVVLEHSRLSRDERDEALAALREGRADVLVTVKALQEGIDVPDVGMGVSVASTASARQRIQTMGRILRLPRAGGVRLDPDVAPVKMLHLLYVRDTVDVRIYREKDWNDETGAERNRWWLWNLADTTPSAGEPLVPIEFTEEQAWERIKDLPMPQRWLGPSVAAAYSHRDGKIVRQSTGAEVANPAPLIRLLSRAPEPRGKFQITPILGVVIKYDRQAGGLLAFGLANVPEPVTSASAEALSPGELAVSAATASPPYDARAAEADDLEEMFSGYWYELLQYGFQAAAREQRATLDACCAAAARRQSGRAAHVRRAFEELLSPTSGSVGAPPDAYPDLLLFAARAFNRGDNAKLQQAEEAFSHRASREPRNKKQRGEALVNAIRLLRGTASTIVLDEKGD